jgi:membrane dipeptidase
MACRRSLSVRLSLMCVVGMGLLTVSAADENETLDQKAAAIHDRVWTVDTHVDTPMRLVGQGFDIGVQHDVRARGGRVDLPRMKAGGLDAIFFAVYLDQGERTAEANERTKQEALGTFEAIHKAVAQHPEQAALATGSGDAEQLEQQGKRAIYIGIENGYAIGQDITLLQKYYDLGARYVTLCHSRNNDICDSSSDEKGPEHHGLSEFGKQVVHEMNVLGMIVDISHASDESFYDVLEVSQVPVIASHSCARAICNSPRNLDDDMLRALAKKGGVIQICILDAYLKNPQPNPDRDQAMQELRAAYGSSDDLTEEKKRERFDKWEEINRKFPRTDASVADIVDHIDHVVKVAGIDYVGIGTDFDGGGGVTDCRDVSEMGNITRELVRRGYTEDQIRKIWGGNFLRVFREVERWAKRNSLKDKIDWPNQDQQRIR